MSRCPHKLRTDLLLVVMLWLPVSTMTWAADAVDYASQIKPLLKKHCFACHGALKQNAQLRLDAGQLLLKGGESGPAIVPGKPSESALLQRVTETDSDLKMPQQGAPLKPAEIALIKTWIQQGASFPSND